MDHFIHGWAIRLDGEEGFRWGTLEREVLHSSYFQMNFWSVDISGFDGVTGCRDFGQDLIGSYSPIDDFFGHQSVNWHVGRYFCIDLLSISVHETSVYIDQIIHGYSTRIHTLFLS